ncbi:hypersensitive-induced response 3-like [Micractinium conductrix]|uniref:Hypersensitive-induced response 3-like n=1 Tax=Micractinium conductrix TaxID=554055 RepID=A0A2P6VN82_9CHLO|nr:hypersensitive-induced response 3-like [Micractinium conductrix]|eukprot:PSC75561.1 hypersensitive-induced response 3-like [Micractinium conductrix]
MGIKFSQTAAVPLSGTKAASQPRRTNGKLRRLRCCTAVDEGSVEVIERFGGFRRIARPGFNCVMCCFGEGVAGRLSTAVQHQEASRGLRGSAVQAEVKTSDGVFVELVFSVQFRAAPDRLYAAFYSLQDPTAQVTSYVLDALGTAVSHLAVDDLFANKVKLIGEVRRGLDAVLHAHGYQIEDCLITALAPIQSVREAMSNVIAAQRQRVAAAEQGEADKLRTVKHAEASAESKYLQVGGIRSEDLAFPEPPPRDDTAALEAAGATQTPMPEDGQQPEGRGGDSGTSGKWQPRGGAPTGTARVQEAGWQQRVARKAPGPPAAEALSKPLLGGEWAGGGVGTAVRVAQPALLAPHAPPTPSRGGAPSKGAASGAASGARAAAGALGF